MTAPTVTLYDWGPSPFCHKVRAVLAHKGIAYEKKPALAHVLEVRRRGGIGKVPAVELDGRFLVDSTDIVHAIEARVPTPSVVPPGARERGVCHALEDWADESLYFFGLYYHWHEPEGRRRAQKFFARTLLGRFAFPPFLLRVERQLFGHGLSRKNPEHVRRDLEQNLDAIERMLDGRSFLVDDQPRLADFAVMSQLVYLSLTPTFRELQTMRPTLGAYLARVDRPAD